MVVKAVDVAKVVNVARHARVVNIVRVVIRDLFGSYTNQKYHSPVVFLICLIFGTHVMVVHLML